MAPDDGFGFPRQHRLTRGPDIQHVIREGKRIRTAYLDVRVLASPLGLSRIGIIVPRHQHSAVDRNRLKRRLRELARIELLPSLRDGATDVAIRARREAYDAEFNGLRRDVVTVRDRTSPGATSALQRPPAQS
ncbi:MAG TPA: ribonuclease P protein component [Gemmatimonadaceae bacterium]